MPEFAWDEAKERRNRVKHGMSFKQATAVFSDPHALEIISARPASRKERLIYREKIK